MDREIYYNIDPEHDNDECWGIDYTKVQAPHAVSFCCPHGDCKWGFGDTGPKSSLYKHVVGFDNSTVIFTIRCPICQRYMFVHSSLKFLSPSDRAFIINKHIKPKCPDWPKNPTYEFPDGETTP